MTKLNLFLILVLGFSMPSFAAEEKANAVIFESIKAQRENYEDKFIKIEGKIKDLKVIREGMNKFATFFLTDATEPETTISVKINLSKNKTVINTFLCKEGDFTIVQGRFKPWGNASYLGKIDIRDSFEFKCSEVAKKKVLPKDEEPMVVVSDQQKPTFLKMGTGDTKIVDARGKKITKTNAVLEPGTVIKTGTRSSVQLKYSDGSKVSIGANSKLTTEAGIKEVKTVNLKYGRVHALIHKEQGNDLHFKIKIKNATMGVRGTQFFVNSDRLGNATIQVIEGRVDVAKDDAGLKSSKVKSVFHDESVDVNQGKISDPQHFDASAYLALMKAEQPEMMAFNENEEKVKVKEVSSVVKPTATQKVANKSEEETKKTGWTIFRLAALANLNKNSSETFNGMISWNPETHFIGNWNLSLDLGYGPKNSVLEYALVGAFVFNTSIAAELKVGAQSWLSPTSASGALGGIALRFGLCDRCVISHLVLGDDVLSLSNKTYNVVRFALGFNF